MSPGALRSAHTGWRRDGESLVRELEFRDFSDAIAFLERIAANVQDHLRRPDMCILGYNRVRLTITNPHHAGLTAAEVRLAEKVNALVNGASATSGSK
ncbi:MAG TPA: 4a-hydroxytetrahydrobiopterin dehydratase [Solirubrobacteraceae bacterium]|nr:4a-hydroxytetrahydrobiopterin dehydratase [Solirubrobacteraceae bacterium]